MKTTEYGTYTVKPYAGAGTAFEGVWKHWHEWEWSPGNPCRVESLWADMQTIPGYADYTGGFQIVGMFPGLKKALATPNWDCGGTYEMMENPGYGCLDTEVTYSPPPDHDFEAAQELIGKFEAMLLDWCKSIDGGK